MSKVIAYVNDLIIFSASPDDHKLNLNELFQRLSSSEIVINLTKSQFGMSKLNFLDYEYVFVGGVQVGRQYAQISHLRLHAELNFLALVEFALQNYDIHLHLRN